MQTLGGCVIIDIAQHRLGRSRAYDSIYASWHSLHTSEFVV